MGASRVVKGTWAEDIDVCAGAGEGMGVQMDGYREWTDGTGIEP